MGVGASSSGGAIGAGLLVGAGGAGGIGSWGALGAAVSPGAGGGALWANAGTGSASEPTKRPSARAEAEADQERDTEGSMRAETVLEMGPLCAGPQRSPAVVTPKPGPMIGVMMGPSEANPPTNGSDARSQAVSRSA